MTGRLVVWFAVVAAVLVVTASPASALTAGSVNDSVADFNSAALENAAVVDGGTDKVQMLSTKTTTDIGDSTDTTGPLDYKTGVQINSSTDLIGVSATLMSGVSGATKGYLVRASDEQTVATSPIENGRIFFDATVSAGVDYYVVVDAEGSDYTRGNGPDTPISGTDITVLSAAYDSTGSFLTTDYAMSIKSVSGLEASGTESGYVGQSHDVGDAKQAFVSFSALSGAEAQVTAEYDDGSGWEAGPSTTVTTAGEATVALSDPAKKWRLNVSVTKTDSSAEVAFTAEGIRFEESSPAVSAPDPADASEIDSYDGTVSVDISDPDFGTAQGDTVTVVARKDGTTINSTTLSANKTVTFSYSAEAGANTIEWEAGDSYGSPNGTLTQEFSTPAKLKLRTETNPSEPITSSGSAEVTFFGDTTVETRGVTNGTADLSGLPAGETFVAVVSLDGYYQRRILIESLFDQQTVYLLNESETAVDVEFVLDDSTGQFSNGDVQLVVDKAIVVDNETEFRTVVGDRISASGTLPASLEQGARYRVAVSKDGNTRSLGSYTASSSGFVELPIGRVELSGEFDEGWVLEHSIDETEQGDVLRLKYVDQEGVTESIETTVVRLNDSGGVAETVLPNATETDTQSLVRSTVVDNSTDTFAVRYTIVRDGETIAGERRLGELGTLAVPVDAGWLNLISWVAVFGFGGLVVIKDSRAAGLVMAGSASLFAMLGWLQAPTAVLGLSAAAAVVWAVAGSGGGY